MLHPSYTDLMKVVNADVEEGATKIVNSRYSIVLATSKRARQIAEKNEELGIQTEEKPVITAAREYADGVYEIVPEQTTEEEE